MTHAQEEEEELEAPLPRPKKRPRNRDHQSRSSDHRPPNPYITTSTHDDQVGGTPASPQYSPPSPESGDASSTGQSSVPPVTRLGEPNHSVNVPPIPAAPGSAIHHYPPPPAPISVAPTTAVSAADALSYAMTSQYWAGYWMGVSQAVQQQESGGPAAISGPADHPDPLQPSDPSPRSNVVVSKNRVLKR